MAHELHKTSRGFARVDFTDLNDAACSLQKSSLATEAAIWLGPDHADPRYLKPGQGWVRLPFPEGTLFTTRMHLTRQQVKNLLPYLIQFAETGELA